MKSFLQRLHTGDILPGWLLLVSRFTLGLAIGVLFHYMLYRIFLPMKPFIYAAF